MAIKPLGDRVLVKVEEADQKTAGGIYIPDTAQEKTQNGVVSGRSATTRRSPSRSTTRSSTTSTPAPA